MKKWIILSLISLILVLVFIHQGHSQTQSYYSGDAINFNNSLYITTTNTGSLEIFKLENKSLKRLIAIKPLTVYGKSTNFYSAKFSIENNQLYIYAVDGFTLYKYQLINNQLRLIKKVHNTYWEWYNRVDKFGHNIVTISKKGVSVWNNNLENIISYPLPSIQNRFNYTPYNVRADNNNYILNIQNNYLTIFDRSHNSQIRRIPLDYQNNPGNHQAYQDNNGNIFVVDDSFAKKFDLNGHLLAKFKHLDYSGYDVASSGHNNYIYFSNGVGVVKLNKQNMKLVTSRWTNRLGGPRGWAMGLKVVYLHGDKVVIFNNSNILVLDQNLNKIASFTSTQLAKPRVLENLYLNLNQTYAYPGAIINLKGGGFLPSENLSIDFAGTKTKTVADVNGRFQINLLVPKHKNALVDIKVSGLNSKLSYSTSFHIQ